jgi:cytochrome c-type biogenesis protein CcmE
LKRIYFVIVAGIILAMTLCISGCSKTNNVTEISDIIANSAQYNGKTVNISGYVGDTLWNDLTSRGAYQVNDGSGNIWVVTSKDPPAKGVKVSVTGTVSPAFTLGDRTLGTVVNETKRD